MFTLHNITRAIYEAIRTKLVQEGVLVDYTAYPTAIAYEQAKQTLANSLKSQDKTVVEVIKPTGLAKRPIESSMISIEVLQVQRGSVGYKNKHYYEANDEQSSSFAEKKLPAHTSTIDFEIKTFAKTTNDDFLLIELVEDIFTNGESSFFGVNADNTLTEKKFNCEKTESLVLQESERGLITRTMTITVSNIKITSDRTVATNVPPFSTFVFDLVTYFETVDSDGVVVGPGDGLNPSPIIDGGATNKVLLVNESSKYIVHELEHYPIVEVYEESGALVIADVIQHNTNSFTVSLNQAINGFIIYR